MLYQLLETKMFLSLNHVKLYFQMKNLKSISALCAILFIVFNAWSNDFNKNFHLVLSDSELIGQWHYTVVNAPYEYSKGVLIISKSDDHIFQVAVNLSGNTVNGQEVVIKGNEINFKVYIEGSPISVKLIAKGDSISGESVSQEGTLEIQGQRSTEGE